MDSLIDKFKRPHTPHTEDEINNLIRRNPNIGLNELYGKLKQNYAYTRHPSSLSRFLRKQGVLFQNTTYKKKKVQIGKKMQLDIKYVPKSCYSGNDGAKFYQYTIIDESSKERFIYAYDEYNSYNTVEFVKRVIIFFSYIPQIIQTDNGAKFRHTSNTKYEHLFAKFCRENNILHKCNRPRTLWHNGKVERNHREGGKRFYSTSKFYSPEDLNKQMKAYLKKKVITFQVVHLIG
ncbi:MAG: DDE-type integrase/transposase/recombinase [Bacilli bacterium]